jgi:1-aminocyclopropane-1-carboxylate deaminase
MVQLNPLLKNWLEGDIRSLANRYPPQLFRWSALNCLGIECWIKRDDLIDPLVSGNKLYKLWGHIQQAMADRACSLVSFGGAYSNHLHALAAAGKALGIETHGVVRGHSPRQLSPTLKDCQALGMKLLFVGYQDYRDKEQSAVVRDYMEGLNAPYLVPEGGGGQAGASYCSALMDSIRNHVPAGTTVCLPCGTGTTFHGLLQASRPDETLLGFGVLKPSDKDLINGLPEMVRRMAEGVKSGHGQWQINFDFHGGGYAKASPELLDFILAFEEETGIPLDPVYTGKMMWGILQLAQAGFWRTGDRLLAIHTGGLQGRRGFPSLMDQTTIKTERVASL